MSQLDRRTVVIAAVAVAGTLLATSAGAADPKKEAQKPAAAGDTKRKAVVDALAVCIAASRVCMASCTDHLAMGMSNMADCQKSVMNMIPVCEAMAAVAAYNTADAKLAKSLASTCAAFCRSCEKTCEPHAAKHAECKACFEACKACAAACEAFAA